MAPGSDTSAVPPGYVLLKEALALYGVSKTTMHRMVDEDRVEYIRMPRAQGSRLWIKRPDRDAVDANHAGDESAEGAVWRQLVDSKEQQIHLLQQELEEWKQRVAEGARAEEEFRRIIFVLAQGSGQALPAAAQVLVGDLQRDEQEDVPAPTEVRADVDPEPKRGPFRRLWGALRW